MRSTATVATSSRFPGAILVLAALLLVGSTAEAQSLACRFTHCDDGDPCTADSCHGFGVCVFEPVRCDDNDECTVDSCDASGACRHTLSGCDDQNPCTTDVCSAGTCVNTALGDGDPCPDDGFTCTDDACTGGSCLHVPIDSRCLAPGECASAACAPRVSGADAAGCLPGTPLLEGAECAEDGAPCTDDVCRANSCVHASVPDAVTCEPVTRAFRLTLVLVSQAHAVADDVARLAPPETDTTAVRALVRLAQLELALRDAARMLAGKTALESALQGQGIQHTTGQLRAIAASDRLAGTPGLVRETVFNLRRLARSSDPQLAANTIERGLALRRGVRRLKIELRRVRRVQQTFAP